MAVVQARFEHVPANDSRRAEGIRLFNQGRYFESHEVWESLWRDVSAVEREMLQGLIQVAAAYYHVSRGNLAGATFLLTRAREHLRPWQPVHAGVPVGDIMQRIAHDLLQLQRGVTPTASVIRVVDA